MSLVKENLIETKFSYDKFFGESFERLGDILRPKTREEVTGEIKRRLEGKDLDILKQTPDFVIYHVKRSEDIEDIVINFGGATYRPKTTSEDVFYNFYLILDNSVVGFKQILGIKVSPDKNMDVMDAKGNKVESEYLSKFS